MAKPEIMSFYEILLLLIISASATFSGYLIYKEYKRIRHLRQVKEIVFAESSDFDTIYKTANKETSTTATKTDKIKAQLLLAGVEFPFFVFALLGFAYIMLIGALLTLFLHHWMGFIIAVFFAGLTLYMFVMMLKENRKKKFNRALSSAISVLVKMMKNGIGFEQALAKSIEVSSCSMFKSLFKDFFAEKNTIGEMAAFENIYKHVDSKELRIFALAIKIGRESGGQFSNTLAKVEQTINYRKKMQDKVDVLTREGNFGSYVVIGIAILLYIMINANFDGRVHQFFMESEFGRFELLGIITWVFFGMLANKLVTKVDK